MKDHHFGVYIGRFQPLHVGHEQVIRDALERVETLIVVVGSSFIARTPVNPFTFNERQQMIEGVFAHEVATGRVIVVPANDYEDDDAWADEVRSSVKWAITKHRKASVELANTRSFKIALAGFGKDASSFYLKMFPEWSSIQLGTQHGTINASDIRDEYLRQLPHLPHDAVSPKVLQFLRDFALSQPFKDMLAYKRDLDAGRKIYGTGPFLAADALVTWRGKVLLVTRGKPVGKGCLAMPGGFVEKGERFFDAALRELREETTIEGADIADFYEGHLLADNPNRSLRGRIVSVVFHFQIPDDVEVKTPQGSDDASHADWYAFDELTTDQFFEDHHALISDHLKEVTL